MANLLKNRLLWKIVGALLIGLLIFFVGPLVAIGGFRPLGNVWVCTVVALLPLIAVGVLWWLARRREAKKNAELVNALSQSSGRAEAREMESKAQEALSMLRSLKLGKGRTYLYQLPWYAIIGPSRAGKTTALLNSGLKFPTAVEGEYRAMRGQPNTPNCEWWFTDEAVLIDTAGRFVSQDEDSAADAQGWRNFMELLKKHRPLQPLNGVIVAIPAPDLSDPALLEQHLANLRARLWELGESLNQNLPVYVMITKADLIYGFREYFGRANEMEADQVLGSTAIDPAAAPQAAVASIESGLDRLIERLAAQLPDRLQLEPHLPARSMIAAFPQEIATLRKPIGKLLERIVQATRFEKPPRIRGVFFSSGTQTGNPIDRVLMVAGAPPLGSDRTVGRGRSYFLRRFFSDLMVPEAGLATDNPVAEKRQRIVYAGSLAAASLALVVALGIWLWGYLANVALIEKVEPVIAAYREREAAAGPADSPGQVGPLDVLSGARDDFAGAADFGLGLGQADRLAAGVEGIYHRDLKRRLAPLLASLAEKQMQANQGEPAALYDDLKAYLILGGQGPSDQTEHLATWVQSAWAGMGGDGGQSAAVAKHTGELVAAGLNGVPIDATRRDSARAVLRAVAPAVRVYGRLKSEALRSGEPMWTARAHAGPQPETFFDPGGALAPSVGIPALFTRNGYDKLFLPMLAKGPTLLKEEKWVVGDTGGAGLSTADLPGLKRDLEQLYFEEFLRLWRAYLDGLKPKPVANLSDNIGRLRGASDPLSPIPPLLRAIVTATDFTTSKREAAAKDALTSRMPSSVTTAAGLASAGPTGSGDARANVISQFQQLRLFVGTDPATSPLSATLATMRQVADKLAVVTATQGGGTIDQAANPTIEVKALVEQLRQGVPSMPAPMAGIVQQLSGDTLKSLGVVQQDALKGAVGQAFGAACGSTLEAKFPVNPGGTDMTVAEFTQFFAPGTGSFGRFLTGAATTIDRSTPQWRPAAGAQEVGLNQADVTSLQTADMLGRAFFSIDPTRPQLSFAIEPISITGAKQVTLRLNGQSSSIAANAGGTAMFDWPGDDAGGSIEFERDGAPPAVKTWPGVWAAFKMMRAAGLRGSELSPTATGQIDVDGAVFAFRVRTTGLNPLTGTLLTKARCLTVQPGTTAAT